MSKIQLVKQYILDEVKAGRITSGQRLPSCREVAEHLCMNKITVNKAYAKMEEEHIVFVIPRGGFYLVDAGDQSVSEQNVIDFRTVKPEECLIPYREFTHVINKSVDLYKNKLFQYEADTRQSILSETLKVLFEKDGVYTTADQIMITNGAQQAIYLAFQALFLNDKRKLLVEVPSYNLALRLAENLGIDMTGIDRKVDGYDFKEMEALFKKGDIAAFYVIPRHHNPTGYSLTEKDKKKIAELSIKYNVLIIEDDYLADLGSKKGEMPIHYYDTSKRTFYIRSFSKTFMPGIRIGAAVLPMQLVEKVIKLKLLIDLNTSRLTQAALELFIKAGMYEKQMMKVRKSYQAKLRKAKEILLSCSPKSLFWHVPEHGIFIWLKLPQDVDATILEKKLEKRGIRVKCAREFYLDKEFERKDDPKQFGFMRLCIAGVSAENISALATVISHIRSEQYLK